VPPTPTPPAEDPLRPHAYDGIREFDKRLPNWWLFTLYGAILFAVCYSSYYEWLREGPTGEQAVTAAMTRIEAERLASMAATKLDDATLWQMSRNPVFTASGRTTFNSICATCHLASLRGKGENPTAVGPDLTDQVWIHGGRPVEILATVTNGVPAKGMPTWGPVFGQKRITEVVAYVLSHHREGEPVVPAPPAAAAP